jgi:hypothetical protein
MRKKMRRIWEVRVRSMGKVPPFKVGCHDNTTGGRWQ